MEKGRYKMCVQYVHYHFNRKKKIEKVRERGRKGRKEGRKRRREGGREEGNLHFCINKRLEGDLT